MEKKISVYLEQKGRGGGRGGFFYLMEKKKDSSLLRIVLYKHKKKILVKHVVTAKNTCLITKKKLLELNHPSFVCEFLQYIDPRTVIFFVFVYHVHSGLVGYVVVSQRETLIEELRYVRTLTKLQSI